jgi:glycosyltransferase involved in cell wall biosynthesis
MTVHQIKTSLVSIIIPVFNAEKYIGEAIESALSQSYPELEIIVVDDGSTDNTVKVVNSFIEKESKVKLVRQKNSGVAAARNTGIRHSRGEFIAPLDADDIWYPDKISSQVRLMRKSGTDVGLVYTWIAIIDAESKLIGLIKGRPEGNVFGDLILSNPLVCGSVPLFRRRCIELIGGYGKEFYAKSAQGCEDLDLSLRISEHFNFAVVKKILVGYRKIPNSMSWDHKQMKRSHDLAILRLRSRYPEIPNRLLNWSHSFFYLYLKAISSKTGDFQSGLYYLLNAAWRNPALILCNDYRRNYRSIAIQAVKHWIPLSLLAMLRHRRYPKKAPEKKCLADLQQHVERNPQLRQGSIAYLRKRQIEITKDTLSNTLETSAPGCIFQKDASNERAHKNN